MCADQAPTVVYDLIGVGFGPANVAVAGALLEKWEPLSENGKRFLFLEKHDKFRWHPGMLLPNVRMQNSWLKDLATFRNPQSPLTFISYLHRHNRISEFVNRGSVPTRKEYTDYLTWGVKQVTERGIEVHYGTEVAEISKGPENTLQIFTTDSVTGEQKVYFARDIIISPGGNCRYPTPVVGHLPHPQITHSGNYAFSIDKSIASATGSAPRPLRVGVVGSGQSASETALDIRQRLGALPYGVGEHTVDIIISKGAPIPADDTPFVNEIFDPSVTDPWFHSKEHARTTQLKEFASTNYGVNSHSTLLEMFEIIYDQKLDVAAAAREGLKVRYGLPRLAIRNYSTILAVEVPEAGAPGPLTLTIRNGLTGKVTESKYDVLICATGYERSTWHKLFAKTDLAAHYGVHASAPEIELIPDLVHDEGDETSTPSENGSDDTALTTPPPSILGLDKELHISKVRISRNYRLMPARSEFSEFKPRIYVQGLAEKTHGIADSLLSVIGIRAGEIVNDLYGEST